MNLFSYLGKVLDFWGLMIFALSERLKTIRIIIGLLWIRTSI